MNVSSQFEWDGSESIRDIFSYSHSLGPRDTQASERTRTIPLSATDVSILMDLYRDLNRSCLLEPPQRTQEEMESFRRIFIERVDTILMEKNDTSPNKWFLKTNRHSCKDSVLDQPTEKDLNIFREALRDSPGPPLALPLDEIDFAPAFECMCKARLHATAVTTGADAVSLLSRSRRIYEDFELQLRDDIDLDDFYLFFSPFDEQMANHPLHEFRCYLSGKQLKCIAQYAYHVKCPIDKTMMLDAAKCIADQVMNVYLPTLPESVSDAAIDVQCVPCSSGRFLVRLIEVNPLGPGTVWGTVSWEQDSMWLLGKQPIPQSSVRKDTQGEISVREVVRFDLSLLPSVTNVGSSAPVECILAFISEKPCLGPAHSAP